MTHALTVTDLKVETTNGNPILHGVSYTIAPGEVLALVGESGSGKTTAGLAALGHFRAGLTPAGGSVVVTARDGEAAEILAVPEKTRRILRGRTVSYVPQDPALSLNPGLRIGGQIREVLETHGCDESIEDRVRAVLAEVGLPGDDVYQRRYPHQLSGGQQQRVGIAMAFACRPGVVVLDEPTTGLDVVTQALVLDTVGTLTREYQVAALYITHDLAVVAQIAHRVAVMYQGEIVETGDCHQVLHRPGHAYTRRLVDAVPDLDGGPAPAKVPGTPLLRASGVSVSYGRNRVLREVSLDVEEGESVLLLGESGSGKTTFSQCLSGLCDRYTGTVALDGAELARSTRKRSTANRRDIQYVFQSPFSSLNPRRTVAQSVEVPLVTLTDLDHPQRQERVLEMLQRVRLPRSMADRLPGDLSGGERQRVAIARALVTAPRVLVCDEVTSALDVSVQATIIDLLAELRAELGMAMVFVTHNIALAREVADRIAVLDGGVIVESGAVHDVLSAPEHDYTRELLAATPRM